MDNEVRDIITENTNTETQLSASGKVIEYIKNKIVFRNIKPGDKLPTEPELCKLINVSRTAVREAIKILEALNVVQIRRGDGTYISDAKSMPMVNQLLFKVLLQDVSNSELDAFRDAIELEIVRFAITSADENDIKNIRDALIAMQECINDTPDDFSAIHFHDIKFHILLADMAKNKMLREIYLSTMDIYSPLILRNYQSGQAGITGVSSHAQIIDAIEKRDLFAASRAISASVNLCSDWIKISQEKSEQ